MYIYIYTQLLVPFRTHDPPQKKHPSCSPESQDFMKCLVPINMFLFDPSSSPHQKTRQSSSHCQSIEATLSAQGEESSQATSRHKKNIISYVYVYIYISCSMGKYVKKSLLTWIKMEPKMLGNPMISRFFRDVHPTTEMVIL